jgi:hypothetical protein
MKKLLITFTSIVLITVFSYSYKNRAREHFCKEWGKSTPEYTESNRLYIYKRGKVFTNHKELRKLEGRRVIQIAEDRSTIFNLYLYLTK